MKKTAVINLALILSAANLCSVSANYLPNSTISVFYNGKSVKSDVAPQIINDRVMLPMRSIFEAMEANVTWDETSKTITAKRENDTIEMTVGKTVFYVNSEEKICDTAPVIVDDRTLIPIRAVSEALDCDVKWYDYSRVAEITSKSYIEEKIEAEIPESDIGGIRYVEVDTTVNYTGENVPESFFDRTYWSAAKSEGEGISVSDVNNSPSFYNEKLNGLVNFKMTMNDTNSWPSIALAQTDNYSRYNNATCYLISFCKDVIQLQKFIGGARNVIYAEDSLSPKEGGAIYNQDGSVVSEGKTYSVTVGTIKEDEGVRIVLIIDGKTIIDYLDKEKTAISDDGYFGVYTGADGRILFEPAESLEAE